MVVGYGVVFGAGVTLNLITMYARAGARQEDLRKKLALVRWLMFGESFIEFSVYLIAVPIMAVSTLLREASPFTTVPFLYVVSVLVGYGTADVSYWYQTVIALTRLAAALTLSWHRRHVRTPYANAVLFTVSWLLPCSVFAGSALAKAFYIAATPGKFVSIHVACSLRECIKNIDFTVLFCCCRTTTRPTSM